MKKKRPTPVTPKKKMGRPSKLDALDLNEVEGMAGLGLTDEEIGLVLGVSSVTINAWKKRPDFLNALKSGKAKADQKVTQSLYTKALTGDTTACIFWLKNRQRDRWRDKQDHELSGEVKGAAIFLMPRPGEKIGDLEEEEEK